MADPAFVPVSRRNFLKIAGAAGVLAGCSKSEGPRSLMPYLIPPEHIIPGEPLFYRTVCRECPAGCGVTARTREGRVVKLEGNPEDPIGAGALCARGQAALQGLYDPDRVKGPMQRGPDGKLASVSWDGAIAGVVQALNDARAKGSPGRIRLLTRAEPGSAGAVQRAFMAGLGAAPEHRLVFDPFDPTPLRSAGEILFGRSELPAYDLTRARSIVSFGADFVETWLSPVELARGLAMGRGRVGPGRTRSTWIGPRLGLTGAIADAWLPARAGTEALIAIGLLRWLCDPSNTVADLAPESRQIWETLATVDLAEMEKQSGIETGGIARLGRELADRRPSAVLGPGISDSGSQATQLASAVQILNYLLGNIGKTILYGLDPLEDPPSSHAAVRGLIEEAAAGKVDVLFVHHVDPVGVMPAALGAAVALARVPLIVSFSDRPDATTGIAHLVLPDPHTLESLGDVTVRRGVVSLSQPVMTPLWDSRSASQTLVDIMAKIPSPAVPMPFDSYRAFVQSRIDKFLSNVPEDGRAAAGRAAFARGGFYSDAGPEAVSLRLPSSEILRPESASMSGEGDFALVVFPTILRYDGRGTAQTWLREVPDTMTAVSWSSWVELAPKTAARLGVANGDVLAIETAAGKAELPAYLFPGLREDVVALPLGGPESLALLPAAFDAHSGALAWLSSRVGIVRTGRRVDLPHLEGIPYQEGREIVRNVSTAVPVLTRPPAPKTMYEPPAHAKHRWAMSIDLDRCTGCQACVVACYAENNIPVNGPEFAVIGRNMAWIRIERYFGDRPGDLDVDLLPMLCQQCTNAPCEPVCPVYATYHTDEGLNAQVYNRCVGTRYCSNNCPYKVRSFNWRDPAFPTPLDYQLNPDVTVRSKGVMEKCTFCVQRIRAAEIAAEGRGGPVHDGEIVPACAQTCPAKAIVFGDATDPTSRVSALRRDGRAYAVLEDLNTQPAITYLARVREKQG